MRSLYDARRNADEDLGVDKAVTGHHTFGSGVVYLRYETAGESSTTQTVRRARNS